MSLRFFADHCVPNSVSQALRDSGHEVLRVSEQISVDSPDQAVISEAQELNAILVSLNADFGDIVTYPPENYNGIITLQVRNHPEVIPHLLTRLKGYISVNPRMSDYKGKLLLVEAHRIRTRE